MKTYRVLGMMSGTSLDGLDLAFCDIKKTSEHWEFQISQTASVPYHPAMQQNLKQAISLSSVDHLELHNTYGTWLGRQAREFLQKHRLEVDFIASHGHTSHHQPKKGITWQLGSGQHLANESGCKTLADFRTNDVALGGQGAPLVPIGDHLLFGQYDFCLNLGGISNISLEQNGQRIAYDIGLANMILNYITQKVGIAYDEGGQMARAGRLDKEMLGKLNRLEYYQLPIPKSTGYEWFLKEVVPIVDAAGGDIASLLHTAVIHIAGQVAREVRRFTVQSPRTLLITGGGALNTYLIEVLREQLGDDIRVEVPVRKLIEFKEALVFALMGVLRMEGEINVYRSVTGAARDSCSGVIFIPA